MDLGKQLVKGMEEFTEDLKNGKVHVELIIAAKTPDTEIWVGCKDGALVQKETGILNTKLLPGFYSVQFGLKSKKEWFQLRSNKPLSFFQGEVPVVPFEVKDENHVG